MTNKPPPDIADYEELCHCAVSVIIIMHLLLLEMLYCCNMHVQFVQKYIHRLVHDVPNQPSTTTNMHLQYQFAFFWL